MLACETAWEECTLCTEISQKRNRVVPGAGSIEAKLLFVGEGPGADEDVIGTPFIGRSGQLLRHLCRLVGLEDREFFLDNVVMCHCSTPAGEAGKPSDRVPTALEIRNCAPRLDEAIYTLDPLVIVALGTTAFQRLTGSRSTIGSVRGGFYEYQVQGYYREVRYPVIPTFHPSFLLRRVREVDDEWGCWKLCERDLRLAVHLHDELRSRYCGLPKPNRQEIIEQIQVKTPEEGEQDETGE